MKKMILILASVFILLFNSGCSSISYNEVVKTVESPDQKYIAYIFIRDLGATTRESYQLSILKKGQRLGNGSGKKMFI